MAHTEGHSGSAASSGCHLPLRYSAPLALLLSSSFAALHMQLHILTALPFQLTALSSLPFVSLRLFLSRCLSASAWRVRALCYGKLVWNAPTLTRSPSHSSSLYASISLACTALSCYLGAALAPLVACLMNDSNACYGRKKKTKKIPLRVVALFRDTHWCTSSYWMHGNLIRYFKILHCY